MLLVLHCSTRVCSLFCIAACKMRSISSGWHYIFMWTRWIENLIDVVDIMCIQTYKANKVNYCQQRQYRYFFNNRLFVSAFESGISLTLLLQGGACVVPCYAYVFSVFFSVNASNARLFVRSDWCWRHVVPLKSWRQLSCTVLNI